MIVGIVSIGYGNIAAFEDIFEDLGCSVRIIEHSNEIDAVNVLVLPGVGKFDMAIRALNDKGLSDKIKSLYEEGDLRILGVCLGMQLLFDSSEEGTENGLGLLKGRFRRIENEGVNHINMGWRSVYTSKGEYLGRFYFIHNYFLTNIGENCTALYSNIEGEKFVAGVMTNRLLLTQFHPEKSSLYGEKVIRRWLYEK